MPIAISRMTAARITETTRIDLNPAGSMMIFDQI
jgi:hypothetical protein